MVIVGKMVDDREGTALSVSAGFVWDLDGDLLHRLNLLFGAVGSLGQVLVGLWGGEDVGLVRVGNSDATIGSGDKVVAVEGRDDDLDICGGAIGGATGGIDIPVLWGSSSRRVGSRRDLNDLNDRETLSLFSVPVPSSSGSRLS